MVWFLILKPGGVVYFSGSVYMGKRYIYKTHILNKRMCRKSLELIQSDGKSVLSRRLEQPKCWASRMLQVPGGASPPRAQCDPVIVFWS